MGGTVVEMAALPWWMERLTDAAVTIVPVMVLPVGDAGT